MKINTITIRNLRAIKSIHLVPRPNLNFIVGTNGSGKTSILESIYILSRTKSFRTNKTSSIIKHGENNLSISAVLENQNTFKLKMTLVKNLSSTDLQVAGKKQKKLSEVARLLPVGIITPDTQKLLQEGPIYRRLFLDWGVFHVEHEYIDVYKKYKKILNQRNCMLREKNKDCTVWDKELSKYAERIHLIRSSYLKEWTFSLNNYLNKIHAFNNITLKINKGWSDDSVLFEELKQKLSSDISRGFTSVGPHRADIVIRSGSQYVKDILSRGQLKLLTNLMILSQLSLYASKQGEYPIILIDDLDAELDRVNQDIILDFIKKSSFQAFVTMIDKPKNQYIHLHSSKLFHVEHGEVI